VAADPDAGPDAIHARVSAEKGQFAAVARLARVGLRDEWQQEMERRRKLDRLLAKAN